MSKKSRTYQKKPFESTGANSDTSANIYMSMLLSDAWKDLTALQQRLYLYCKAQYYAEKTKPDSEQLYFTMNQSKWCGLYSLYKKTNSRSFYRDMSALIDHGFITCVQCGAATRTKNIYSFSSMWQKYGTEAFFISCTDKTLAMQRKEKKEASE